MCSLLSLSCRLLLLRHECTETCHRFQESNLCSAISRYESMGWVCRHDPGGTQQHMQ